MAFGAQRIFPNDLRPAVGVGIDLPFSGEGVFTPNFQTQQAIKNNLINYFLTNPGERPGNPTFGAGLRKFIFTQIDNQDVNFMKQDIQQKLTDNFPNVIVQDLSIGREQQDENKVIINLTYSVSQTNITDDLQLSFE